MPPQTGNRTWRVFPFNTHVPYSTIEIMCARLSSFTVLWGLRKPPYFLGPHSLHRPSISSSWFCDQPVAPLWPPSSSVLDSRLPKGRAHLLYLSAPPVCLCSPERMSAHSVKISFLVPRKKMEGTHRRVPWTSAGSCHSLQSLDFSVPLFLLMSSGTWHRLLLRYAFCNGAWSGLKDYSYPWQCCWKQFYMPQRSMFIWGPPSHGRQVALQDSFPSPTAGHECRPSPYKTRRWGEGLHSSLRKSPCPQSGLEGRA